MRRHTHALTAVTTLTAAAALAVAVSGAASAQSWTHADPAGDVYKYSYSYTDVDDDPGTETEGIDPTVTNGDVVSTTFRHNARKVIATLHLRDLATTSDNLTAFGLSLRTNKLNRDMVVYAADGTERGRHELDRPNGRTVRCRGLSHRIDYTAHTVTMVVPRSCLGRPRWVKAGAVAARLPDDFVIAEPARSSRTAHADRAARAAHAVGVGAASLARLARAADTPGLSQPSVYEMFLDDALRTGGDGLTYGPRLRRG